MTKHKSWRKVYDSHTHLNDTPFFDDVPAFIARANHYGVVEMNIVGSNCLLNDRAVELGHCYPSLHPVIGWHPEDLATFNAEEEAHLLAQLKDPLVVGVGEIGLDYYNDEHSPHKLQWALFEKQLAWARQLHLPVSIHCRDALADAYAILRDAHVAEFGGVMHSFNGSPAWAEKFMNLGMAISFSGVASFKNATDVHAAVQVVPLDRMMVETDAPYLTPKPFRGKQNEPAFTKFVVDAVAELKQVAAEKVAYQTYHNARSLFLKKDEQDD
ncbi:TatD family hydrolase [Limosilactobacillus kribbianus]|uniref:TatD family hydrolase n=1 Tax=Limosilactobacillus kribbianus TaxID=2982695 RepID=UPI003F65E7C8